MTDSARPEGAVADADLVVPLGGSERRSFMLALLLTTWIPIGFFVVVGSVEKPVGGLDVAKTALLFVGGLHVAASLLLYVDRTFLSLVRQDKVRYVYVPAASIVVAAAVFTFGGPVAQGYAFLVFWAWQAHHYGRQNIGVYSFAGIAGGWRAHRLERLALDLAAVCGICGTFRILGPQVAPSYLYPLFDALYRLGALAFVGVLIFSVYIYVRNRQEFTPSRAVFFFTLVLFFAPMFLSTSMDVAFFSYAIAHGAQYLAFMAVLSVDLGRRDGRRGISGPMVGVALLLVLLVLVGSRAVDVKAVGAVGSSAILARIIDFLAGVGLGTTVAHFVVDAGAWRLSRPSARQYMTRRFGFLFERDPQRSRGVVPQPVSR